MKTSSKFFPWFMWGLAACFYFYQFLLRVATANLRQPLALEFNLSAGDFGLFAAFWLVSYAALQIPIGLALDRWGVKRIFALSALGCSAGTFLMGSTETFSALCFARLLIGASSAAAFVGTVKVASDWFKESMIPILVGVISGIGVLGASFAGAPLVVLQGIIGWRSLFFMLSAIGGVLAVVFLLFLQNKPVPVNANKSSVYVTLKKILMEPQVLLLGGIGFLLYTPISVMADLWGPSFIEVVYGHTRLESAIASSFIFYGNAMGSFISGWVFSLFSTSRKFFITFISVGVVLLFLIVWCEIPNFIILCGALFFLGAIVGAENMVFPLAGRHVDPQYRGLSASVVNFIVMIGPVFLQPAIGFFMDAFWEGSIANGVKVYSAENYQHAFSILLAILALGVCLSTKVKNTKP